MSKGAVEAIKSTILANAHSFILVHNHPSANQQPTREDHKITEDMIEVGRLIKIPFKNFMIIGEVRFSIF